MTHDFCGFQCCCRCIYDSVTMVTPTILSPLGFTWKCLNNDSGVVVTDELAKSATPIREDKQRAKDGSKSENTKGLFVSQQS